MKASKSGFLASILAWMLSRLCPRSAMSRCQSTDDILEDRKQHTIPLMTHEEQEKKIIIAVQLT